MQSSYAENIVRLYCFQGENLDKVKSYLTPILKPTDSVNAIATSNCLEVHLNSVRIPLFDSWLSRRYKFKNSFGHTSSSQITKTSQECRLELIKKRKSQSQISTGSLGAKTNANIETSSSVSSSRSRFLMTAGDPFSFQVNDQNTYITCYKKNAANYQISISLSNNKGALATSVSLVDGQEINIGSIVEALNEKSKSANFEKGLGHKKIDSKSKSDFTLKMY